MTQNLTGTANDLTLGFTFNPAPQVTVRTISNTAYSFAPPTLSEAYARDGLNRYTAVASVPFTWDDRQNLTDDGPNTFEYDLENRLTAVSGGSAMTLAYDPLGRLKQTASGATTTRFLYDGDRLVGEYNAAGTTVTARYAHGAGVDAPLVWYEGATLTDRRWLHADAQGSIIAVSGATGAIVGTPYSYSPYGEPDTVNGWGGSRFRYAGQISLRHAPLWHYKARAYDPALGRFLQTDPVGYEDQMNLYAYVANDPVNLIDPFGLYVCDGNRRQCRQIADTLERLNDAADAYEEGSDERAAISAIVDYYGEEGDDNGVHVSFVSGRGAPRIARFDPNETGGGTIYVNARAAARLGTDVLAIGLGHEGWHGIQAAGGQSPGIYYINVYDYEYRAYSIQYQIAGGLGWGGYSTNTPFTVRRDAARRGAEASARSYCARQRNGCR